jgi:small GTP-binding protein
MVAHVDAGKTTLSEALLYTTGMIRKAGRVDHGDAHLDQDVTERQRGITIFAKSARICTPELDAVLLDTPGHVDFSGETERALAAIDEAVLVISAADGIQAHTRTIWRLLAGYRIPTFIFINKTDLPNADFERVYKQIRSELSRDCIDMRGVSAGADGELSGISAQAAEELSLTDESLLDSYLESGKISADAAAEVAARRHFFPVFAGSALHMEGVDELVRGLEIFTQPRKYPESFGACAVKIGRDASGHRLTFLKVTGGVLKARQTVEYETENGQEIREKIDQIRRYSGESFDQLAEAPAGSYVAVTGLSALSAGQGLGSSPGVRPPELSPVMSFGVLPPEGEDPFVLYQKLKEIEEEDPLLGFTWNERTKEIQVRLMGHVQAEVLKTKVMERFGEDISFGPGKVVYRETVEEPVEGIGHFEPLRHYAEVHVLLSPAPCGSGVTVDSVCPVDVLPMRWQKMILGSLRQKCAPGRGFHGVLTGALLTDVRITLLTGRASVKHTSGGDFREAACRAVRQGLMSTRCTLLEPYEAFTAEFPQQFIGRVMTDLDAMGIHTDAPQIKMGGEGALAVLTGRAPASILDGYAQQLRAVTKGRGEIRLEYDGYDICHNPDEVIAAAGYDPEADLRQPAGSVFCANGAGYPVPWNEVPYYMHVEPAFHPEGEENTEETQNAALSADTKSAAPQARPLSDKERRAREQMAAEKEEADLNEIMAEMNRREHGRGGVRGWSHTTVRSYGKTGHSGRTEEHPKLYLIDGYNLLYKTEELSELREVNLNAAAEKLCGMLSDWQGWLGCRMVVVFDAYKKKESQGSVDRDGELEIIYTRSDEPADAFIEKYVHDAAGRYRITVVTDDNLVRLTCLKFGAVPQTDDSFLEEMNRRSF